MVLAAEVASISLLFCDPGEGDGEAEPSGLHWTVASHPPCLGSQCRGGVDGGQWTGELSPPFSPPCRPHSRPPHSAWGEALTIAAFAPTLHFPVLPWSPGHCFKVGRSPHSLELVFLPHTCLLFSALRESVKVGGCLLTTLPHWVARPYLKGDRGSASPRPHSLVMATGGLR